VSATSRSARFEWFCSQAALIPAGTIRAVIFSVCEEHCPPAPVLAATFRMERAMHGIIYLVGLIVVILAILSFFGLR
jgi:hypothetical protein